MVNHEWVIGACLTTFGSVVINLGTNLLKLSHTRSKNLDTQAAAKTVWTLGILVFVVGNVVNFIAFGFAAQSLLSALGSVQFVSNVIFASTLLGEEIRPEVYGSTLLILLGNSILVLYGSHESRSYTVDELMMLYQQPSFLLYMCVLAVLIVAMYLSYNMLCQRVLNCGAHALSPLMQKYIPFSYAAVSGMIGTQSVLLAKSCSELVRTTLKGHNQFIYPFTYVILVCWISTMSYWFHRLNAGLRQFDASYIVPMFQVVWTLCSIIGGGIYFDEFAHFTFVHYLMFFTGAGMIIFGVFRIAPHVEKKSDPPEESVPMVKKSRSLTGLSLHVTISDTDSEAENDLRIRV